jgi:hypothetical protein
VSSREILFVEATPVPEFKTVTCFEDSWTCHIAAEHPDVAGKLPVIQGVIGDPTHVFVMNGRVTSNVVFFNETVANDEDEPLFVIVDRVKLAMRTAYFKTGWKNFKPSMMIPHTVIWEKKP